jgi:hypothetical protein
MCVQRTTPPRSGRCRRRTPSRWPPCAELRAAQDGQGRGLLLAASLGARLQRANSVIAALEAANAQLSASNAELRSSAARWRGLAHAPRLHARGSRHGQCWR